MNVTRKRVFALVSCGAALLILAACATTPTGTSSQTSGASAGGTPSATAASSTPPITTTTPPLTLATPQAAAEHLYNAWKANDKATALLGATTAAVDALFVKKWATGTYFFGGCSESTAPTDCAYNWAEGIVTMHISSGAPTGLRVDAVSFGSAG